jgi:hypothetical protein
MVKFFKHRRVLLLVASVIAAVLLVGEGIRVNSWRSPQVVHYNEAMAAYKLAMQTGDPKEIDRALALFDQSLSSYQDESAKNGVHRIVLGTPSTETAALAQFHKGVLLLAKAQATKKSAYVTDAVTSFVESLKLNPGEPYQGVSPEDAQRLNDEAMIVKYDLELLFKQHPEQQKQSQSGQGNGPPKPAQQAPGSNPGSQPGHGNNDSI